MKYLIGLIVLVLIVWGGVKLFSNDGVTYDEPGKTYDDPAYNTN